MANVKSYSEGQNLSQDAGQRFPKLQIAKLERSQRSMLIRRHLFLLKVSLPTDLRREPLHLSGFGRSSETTMTMLALISL